MRSAVSVIVVQPHFQCVQSRLQAGAPIQARRGLGGTIIITWPDPCGTIEINPNPANPAGWTPGPVQTSPWEFTPTADGRAFIRLRK